MKRIIYLLVILSISVSACKKESDKPIAEKNDLIIDTTNIKPIEVDQGISLVYDLSKNSVLRYKLTTYNKNSQTFYLDSTISGSVEQNVEYIFKVTVKEKENNGNMTLDILCEQIKADAQSSTGEKLSYDSRTPPVDSVEKLQTKNFEVLVNTEFSARISPHGEVLDIYKTENLLEKIIQDAPRKPSEEEKTAIKSDIEEGVLRPIVQQLFKTLTDKKVNVDSTWSMIYPTQLSIFEIENTATYKVTKVFESGKRKLVKFTGSLSIKPSGQTTHTENNIVYKFSKPKAVGKGEYFYDLDKKLIRKAESDVTFELAVNISQKGQTVTYKRVEIIQTKNTLTLLD